VNSEDLDYNSIAVWLATGFFLGDTHFYYKNTFYKSNFSPDIVWHHSPRNISFSNVVNEFSDLFESVIKKNTIGKNIILPLSGGLDSRTLAVALRERKNVVVISYQFKNGIKETKYAREIAMAYGWEFHEFEIPEGYLWSKLSELSDINQCLTEFTHPRQMAIIDKIIDYGDLILSGQWGDVLFDSPNINPKANLNEQTNYIIKQIVKPGGIELASELSKYWGISESFEKNLFILIQDLLSDIDINNVKSKLRAFKSLHWAPRWANENLKVFTKYGDIFIPYYNNEICNFICTIPEEFLAKRKIQIEYIKQKAPELAQIPWQAYDLDLYRYKQFNNIYFPRRIYRYIIRIIKEKFIKIPPVIERNWELQFLGDKNDQNLRRWLFNNPKLHQIVPSTIIQDFYQKFKLADPIKYSHPLSMLLTLSVWCTKNLNCKRHEE
tara:strand:+ start:12465 stop:13778 length:1314 start_codon:yes stop_codon:yes gene_type:complete